MMVGKFATLVAALVMAGSASAPVRADHCGPACGQPGCSQPCQTECAAACAPAPQPCMVEQTIMVPRTEMETRRITVTECRPENRERRFTVYRQVPERKQIPYQWTEYTTETRTRTENYIVNVPQYRDVSHQYTVMVPHNETRTGSRPICRMVAEKQTQTICEDQGRWEERPIQPACPTIASYGAQAPLPPGQEAYQSGYNAGPGPAPAAGACGAEGGNACGPAAACAPAPAPVCTQRVWVPNIVNRQVEHTVMRPSFSQESFEYQVTVMKPEQRTATQRVCEFRQETRSREIPYQVSVPVQRESTREIVEWRTVPEEKVENFTVMVNHPVEKEIQVPVCRLVAQKISVPGCCDQQQAPASHQAPPAPAPAPHQEPLASAR